MKWILLLPLLNIAATFNAYGASYFEPFIGYQSTQHETQITNDESIMVADKTRFESSGLAVGLRFGQFFTPNIAFGFDAKYAKLSGEGQGITSTETETKTKSSELSLFATSTYFTGPFKFWLGAGLYGIYSESGTYNKDGAEALVPLKSYKAGAGFYPLTDISLNIDFEVVETKQDKESSSYTAAKNYPLGKGRISNVLISLGFRF